MDESIQKLREIAIAAEEKERVKNFQIALHKIALFNFVPKFCPGCGKEFEWDQVGINDYNARNCFFCGCQVKFQQVDGRLLLNAAQNAGGDLANLIEEDIL